MARVVEGLPDGGSRSEKHRYDEWFDGRVWLLEPEDHPGTSQLAMAQTIRAAARRRGIKAVTMRRPEGIYVQVKR